MCLCESHSCMWTKTPNKMCKCKQAAVCPQTKTTCFHFCNFYVFRLTFILVLWLSSLSPNDDCKKNILSLQGFVWGYLHAGKISTHFPKIQLNYIRDKDILT